jgi:hypothetical protein
MVTEKGSVKMNHSSSSSKNTRSPPAVHIMLTHDPYGCMKQVICICVNLKKVNFFLFFFLTKPRSKKKQEVHNLQKGWNVITSKVYRFPTHTLSLVGLTQMKSIIIIVKETVEQFTHPIHPNRQQPLHPYR